MRRSGVRSSSSPPSGKSSKVPRSPGKIKKPWRINAPGLFSCPKTSQEIPTNRRSHCRNFCRNSKIAQYGASEFLHVTASHPLKRDDQSDQEQRPSATTERWGWSLSTAVRQRRFACLAVRLHVRWSAQYAEPWHVPYDDAERCETEGRRGTSCCRPRRRSQPTAQGGPREGRGTTRGSDPCRSGPTSGRLVRGCCPRVVREECAELGRDALREDHPAARARCLSLDRKEARRIDPACGPLGTAPASRVARGDRNDAPCAAELRPGVAIRRGDCAR